MLHSLPLIVSAACALSPADRGIVERTFAAWTHVSHDLLRLPDVSPPPIVLVDPRCTYTFRPAAGGAFRLGGQPVAMSAAEHGDSVTLPNGARLPVGGMAFTSLYGAGDEPFFFAALPGVWAADPKYRDDPEDWAAFLTPVMLHELTHTRQLRAIMRSLEAPGKAVGAADLDDDVIQRRYQSDSAFALAQRRETDLLYEAARTSDRAQRLQLVGRALEARRARHARFYPGRDSAWAAIETRFIDMEGVAQWAAYAHLRDRAASTGDSASALERVRDNRKWWSQEYGLALYLALDATVTDWQRQVFPPAMRSAFDLLRDETVRSRTSDGASRPDPPST